MYKILILSHGRFCEGALDTLRIFLPDTDFVTAIPFYVEGVDAQARYQAYVDAITPEDEVVVFTDLLSGSVNQKAAQDLGQRPNVHIITGFNLPALFEACTLDPQELTPEQLRTALQGWREGLIYMQDYQPSYSSEDE